MKDEEKEDEDDNKEDKEAARPPRETANHRAQAKGLGCNTQAQDSKTLAC